jgi:hypothetical protein
VCLGTLPSCACEKLTNGLALKIIDAALRDEVRRKRMHVCESLSVSG